MKDVFDIYSKYLNEFNANEEKKRTKTSTKAKSKLLKPALLFYQDTIKSFHETLELLKIKIENGIIVHTIFNVILAQHADRIALNKLEKQVKSLIFSIDDNLTKKNNEINEMTQIELADEESPVIKGLLSIKEDIELLRNVLQSIPISKKG